MHGIYCRFLICSEGLIGQFAVGLLMAIHPLLMVGNNACTLVYSDINNMKFYKRYKIDPLKVFGIHDLKFSPCEINVSYERYLFSAVIFCIDTTILCSINKYCCKMGRLLNNTNSNERICSAVSLQIPGT
uniref:Uncharacterized protein n=1 Tax=Pyxicephalus adspersus TaxID=30357 RepID=A0AAV2ZX22_PYXAD|nr:TPA: hypothetical protein GDO54_015718 [Pyxicephalus adspersus]